MANGQPVLEEVPVGEVMPDPPIGSKATVAIEVIRELARNLLGIGAVAYILWMLGHFVEIATDKENVMFLVIGNLTGFLAGIGTWYFGGAMRSALQALRTKAEK
jgi:uncharacterized membrane protein YedE/YeeE